MKAVISSFSLLLAAIVILGSCVSAGDTSESDVSETAEGTDGMREEIHEEALAQVPEEDPGTPLSLEGIWQGVLEAGGAKIRLVFRISPADDGWKAVVDSPDQGVNGIPVESVTLEGTKLVIDVPAVAGRYEGEIQPDGGKIIGAWKQGGGSYAVTLEPIEEVETVKRPQDPEPPYPYRVEEVRFENPDAAIILAGTLTLPQEGGPFPAAVLISGSGSQDRNQEIFNHRPFLVVADFLTRRGFAVLRFDDRGIGGSGGDASAATSEDFAGDAWSAFSFLLRRPDIDHGAIGFIGHSEGGIIAPMIAAEHPEVAFLVLLAAPGIPGDELIAAQSKAILKGRGVAEQQIAVIDEANRKIYDIAKNEPDDEKAAEEIGAILKSLGMENNQIQSQLESLLSPWFRFFLRYDPAPALRRTACPVLALNGGLDLQVLAAENLAVIEGALREGGNSDVTVKKLDGLNHLFQHTETGLPAEYPLIDETFAPEALEIIAEWMAEVSSED